MQEEGIVDGAITQHSDEWSNLLLRNRAIQSAVNKRLEAKKSLLKLYRDWIAALSGPFSEWDNAGSCTLMKCRERRENDWADKERRFQVASYYAPISDSFRWSNCPPNSDAHMMRSCFLSFPNPIDKRCQQTQWATELKEAVSHAVGLVRLQRRGNAPPQTIFGLSFGEWETIVKLINEAVVRHKRFRKQSPWSCVESSLLKDDNSPLTLWDTLLCYGNDIDGGSALDFQPADDAVILRATTRWAQQRGNETEGCREDWVTVANEVSLASSTRRCPFVCVSRYQQLLRARFSEADVPRDILKSAHPATLATLLKRFGFGDSGSFCLSLNNNFMPTTPPLEHAYGSDYIGIGAVSTFLRKVRLMFSDFLCLCNGDPETAWSMLTMELFRVSQVFLEHQEAKRIPPKSPLSYRTMALCLMIAFVLLDTNEIVLAAEETLCFDVQSRTLPLLLMCVPSTELDIDRLNYAMKKSIQVHFLRKPIEDGSTLTVETCSEMLNCTVAELTAKVQSEMFRCGSVEVRSNFFQASVHLFGQKIFGPVVWRIAAEYALKTTSRKRFASKNPYIGRSINLSLKGKPMPPAPHCSSSTQPKASENKRPREEDATCLGRDDL